MRAPVRRAYAPSRFGQIHYRIAGAPEASRAPPLLCLHQTPKSGWEYEPIMARLGVDRVVIAPDNPGYGASDGPDQPTTIEVYAQALSALVEHLQATGEAPEGPFDVMGLHTGAVLATELARTNPDRVRRAVLIGLAAYDAPTRAEKLAKLENYPRPKEDLSHVEAIWRVMNTLMDPRTTPAWRHRSLAENIRSGDRMSWGYSAVYRYDFIKALGEVTQPALVINPEDDLSPITPGASRFLPNGRLVDLPGTKHGLFAVETDAVVQMVTDFLSDPG